MLFLNTMMQLVTGFQWSHFFKRHLFKTCWTVFLRPSIQRLQGSQSWWSSDRSEDAESQPEQALQGGAPHQPPLPPQPWQVEALLPQLGHQDEGLETGLEMGAGQGFPWACLGPRLRVGEAREEDRNWLLGSGEGLLGEREGVAVRREPFLSQTPPT